MPNTAKILRFPKREDVAPLSRDGARSAAFHYLETPHDQRPEHFIEECLSVPETLFAICELLKDRREISPSSVYEESSGLFARLKDATTKVGIFDEREYLLGELALVAGGTSRLLGNRDEAALWFDRAEAQYRHTVNPGPALANVAYSRLTLQYDRRDYNRVFEFLPSVFASFTSFGMDREALRCRFLEAMALKEVGRFEDSCDRLSSLRKDERLASDLLLQGLTLVNLGDLLAMNGSQAQAVAVYGEALPVLQRSGQPIPVAHLKASIGESLRREGRKNEAVEAFRAAIGDFSLLQMTGAVAGFRIVVAELLIEADRNREAEWEILAALPTIEEQKMVPEGFAAVALLKESVRRRKTDPNALRELREHLQASK